MKIFTNKNLIQKLIIAIVTITLLNFCVAPMQVQAAGFGGILADGAKDLILVIGDGAISIAYFALTGTWVDAVERNAVADTKGRK